MSTAYHTSAKPRGRREIETLEKHSRSRASSESLSLKSTVSSVKAERTSVTEREVSKITSPPKLFPRLISSNANHPPLSDPKGPHARTQAKPRSRPSTPDAQMSDLSSRLGKGSSSQVDFTDGPAVNPPSPTRGSMMSHIAPGKAHAEGTVEINATQSSWTTDIVLDKPGPAIEQASSRALSDPSASAEACTPTAMDGHRGYYTGHYLQPGAPMLSSSRSPQLAYYTGPLPSGQLPYYHQTDISPGSQSYYGPNYTQAYSPRPEISMMASTAYSLRAGVLDENNHLLERISDVLPDIHALLEQYRMTQGHLSAQHFSVQQAQSMHAELDMLRLQLNATRSEYENVIREIVGDNSRLKSELESAQARATALEMSAIENEASLIKTDDVQPFQQELDDSHEALKFAHDRLEADKAAQNAEIISLQTQLLEQNKLFMAKKDEHVSLMQERETYYSEVIAERERVLSKVQIELTTLATEHSAQKSELEATRVAVAEHKTKYQAKVKELEDVLNHHIQDLNVVRSENDVEKRNGLMDTEERVAKLVDSHNTKVKEMVLMTDALRAEIEVRNEKLEDMRTRREEHLKAHAQLRDTLSTWKGKQLDLQQEYENIDRILQSFPHAPDTPGKDD